MLSFPHTRLGSQHCTRTPYDSRRADGSVTEFMADHDASHVRKCREVPHKTMTQNAFGDGRRLGDW
jgi:hypothetical protein